jgi:hypothetical protein
MSRPIKFPLLGVVFVLALVLAAAAPAGAITDGTVDSDDDFPFVAMAVQFLPDGGGFICSTGAIDEWHLVTAAHCFQDFVPPEAGGPANVPVPGIVVFYGVDPLFVGPPDAVATGTWFPDEWCPACAGGLPGFDSKDLAVIKLDDPVPLDEYVALPDAGLSDDLRNKTPVMLAGYGVNGFTPGGGPLSDNANFDGKRRFAPADLIASNHKHADEYLKISGNPSKGKGGTCFGDSGSPAMYDDGERWIILANTSYGPNGVCAGPGYYNRVDTQEALAFIDSIVDP